MTGDYLSQAEKEQAIRKTYETMLKLHPESKDTLDLMLKLRLSQIGVSDD